MNSKSDPDNNRSNQIDHLIGLGDDIDIDIDLSTSDQDGRSSTEVPDLILGSSENSTSYNLNGSDSSKSLTVKPNSDVTVRGGEQHLDRMRDNQLLDAHDFQERKIVHPAMEKYEILNAYREIRTRLINKSEGKNLVVMAVSIQHGMGTTFNAVNLAAAFSYEGEKTSLLIDCDFAKKKLNGYFPDNVEYGLTDFLSSTNISTEKIIYQTGIPRMRYIPVGSKTSTCSEFFSSEKMRNFIRQIKKRYSDRYIILNAPPIEASVDAAILSEVSDFIIFVLPYGKVSNSRLQKALKLLPREKIVGFVINNKIKHV